MLWLAGRVADRMQGVAIYACPAVEDLSDSYLPLFRRAAQRGTSFTWSVAKTAWRGDTALIYLSGRHAMQFVAYGRIDTMPRYDGRDGRYYSRLVDVELLLAPVDRETVMAQPGSTAEVGRGGRS